MIEKAKTVSLIVLVFLSLLQSYLLSGSAPYFERVAPGEKSGEYVPSELTGTQLELQDVMFPSDIVLHFGGAKHTVLYPEMTFYTMIMEKLKQRSFDGFSKVTETSLKWEDFRNLYQGVEIRFRDGIAPEVLQRLLQLKGDLSSAVDPINRIWIVAKENKEDVRTLFISDGSSTVYEATKADLTVKDLEGFIGLGSYLTAYLTGDGRNYLPEKDISMVQYRYGVEEMTPEQLQRSLFADPTTTRSLSERDGSQIYTDGKRGLQIRHDLKWMGFSDPAAPTDTKNDIRENLVSAIQFVNQHGGWNGSFIVSRLPQKANIGNQTILFRQYAGNYPGAHPIIADTNDPFGLIKVVVQKGVVTDYERSLLRLTQELGKDMAVLPGGAALEGMIASYEKKSMIVNIFPAYRPALSNGQVELRPVWAVELFNGTYDYLR